VEEIVLGLVAVVAGSVFCFAGYRAFRVVIPLWGAFLGFATGVGVVSALTDDAVLATPAGWIVGVLFALGFALFAYLYVVVAIVLSMASAGFVVGVTLMVALGVRWNWVIVAVAVATAVGFAVLAIATNLPRAVLTVVSAVAGAAAIVTGAMLLVGTLEASDLSRATVTEAIENSTRWWLFDVVLVVAGIVVQLASAAHDDDRWSAWADERSSSGS